MSRFPGCTPLDGNFTSIPNVVLEHLDLITSMGELKVVMYVMRHTFGFRTGRKEYQKSRKITIDEFMHGRKFRDGTRMDGGTGLSRPTVLSSVKKAVEHGFLSVEVDDRDGGRIKKFYSPVMADEVDSDDESLNNFTPPSSTFNPTCEKPLPPTEKKRDRKKGIERNFSDQSEHTLPHPVPQEPSPIKEESVVVETQESLTTRTPTCPAVTTDEAMDSFVDASRLLNSSNGHMCTHEHESAPASSGILDCPDNGSQRVEVLSSGMRVVTLSQSHPRPSPPPLTKQSANGKAEQPSKAPTKKRQKEIGQELLAHFCETTGVIAPEFETPKQFKAGHVRWFRPLGEIARICGWDVGRAKQVIDKAWAKFVQEQKGDWVSAPQSLVATCRALSKKPGKAVSFGGGTNGSIPLTDAHKSVSLLGK